MPRKPMDLGPRTEKKIASLMKRGGTAESIEKALRAAGIKGVSRATIGRRMRELRGSVAAPRVSADAARRAHYASPEQSAEPPAPDSQSEEDMPTTPEAIPEGAHIAQIDRWLKRAEVMGQKAAELGDVAAIGQMGRLSKSLLEARQKAEPLDKNDPKEQPDWLAAAARARVLLHRYIDKALGKSDGEPAT